MRAIPVILIGALAGCAAKQPGAADPCKARWHLDHLEQRDPLTQTWDATSVDPSPLWTGDLDKDGKGDVVLRYQGSRAHEVVVLRACGGERYQVVLDEVHATRVGTSPGADGWLDLVMVDGDHKTEFQHGASGYSGPPKELHEDFHWK
jgi:hypothetical protein